ncbi:hypothetical protein [Winogradskyella sp. Asnod2-B02-A]|uniref:hypothetical protein n=1 Tax=Winogradskyella sp. Asnod2-B02-A TaxID=3160583 RepID=UPI003865A379
MNILDQLKKKSVKRFSLFFAISFVFLIISKLSNDYKQTIKLKVNLVGFEDEIVLKNDSANYIIAYVEAKGFALVPLMFKNSKVLQVKAKKEVTVKSNHFIFDVQKHKFLIESQLGSSYDLVSVLPDTLLIAFSKRASKKVPITLKQTINYVVGYDLKGDFKFDIDSVKIVGAASEVDKINTITTEDLVLKDIKSKINESVKLDISDYQNIEIFPKSIKVSAEVARFTEGTVDVPLTITNQPNDVTINYFPKTVSISYYVDLENYNAVNTSDFKVECNYAELEENQTYLVPKVVKKPNFVKHINIKQKRIDFIKL